MSMPETAQVQVQVQNCCCVQLMRIGRRRATVVVVGAVETGVDPDRVRQATEEFACGSGDFLVRYFGCFGCFGCFGLFAYCFGYLFVIMMVGSGIPFLDPQSEK